MNSKKIRNIFFDYFKSKNHKIIQSAPITVNDDPTLMFTNAGMNQFKDIFLGNESPSTLRKANTQKCLRVSGKHNDLEEVGIDKYHHTMFEMLGNWSFGDYFKKDAIEWAWDLLVNHYKLDEKRLFVTVFGGDSKDNLDRDDEAAKLWNKIVDNSKIIDGSKSDNFWEMGEVGPCGPCSEIHIDLRSSDEMAKTPTKDLINKDHPEVIEIWNLVFIEFNRKKNGSLEPLPNKHVDTGMGLERLSMAIDGLKSTYDTDFFVNIISALSKISKINYGDNEKKDIAFRVISDHIRAIVFTISDGAIPSNNKSGYVVRRILRRAVRYGFSSLDLKSPFLHILAKSVIKDYKETFENLEEQESFILKVILEEEKTFLKTLEKGLKKINDIKSNLKDNDEIPGQLAFELYDTYGFPYDLTELIARENNLTLNKSDFNKLLNKQRDRSRSSSQSFSDDWVNLIDNNHTKFIGYNHLVSESKILKYREVKIDNKSKFHIVLDKTPFYPESGGQVGDSGKLKEKNGQINVLNTLKENDLIIHLVDKLPNDLSDTFTAKINVKRRKLISKNHSATHLLHSALREILGDHVVQKGSLVNDNVLRFDFSHFSKLSTDELKKINDIVNNKIFQNIDVEILENVPIEKAKKMGATALFGEKYGDKVRVVTIDEKFSVELCGGTHVSTTSEIGLFKIISESSVSSGVRRVEALTSLELLNFSDNESSNLKLVKDLLKTNNILDSVKNLINKNKSLQDRIGKIDSLRKKTYKEKLINNLNKIGGKNLIIDHFKEEGIDFVKQMAFELDRELKNLVFLATIENESKPFIVLLISKNLANESNLDARNVINNLSKKIKGSGGGQNFLSTAGGNFLDGLSKVRDEGKIYFAKVLNY